MVTRRVLVRSCDRCSSTEDVEQVRVQHGPKRRTFSFDTCKSCYDETPLSEWDSLKGGSRRVRRQVVDPAVVEKATVKKAPRKRAAAKR